jgi:hypothetical protein
MRTQRSDAMAVPMAPGSPQRIRWGAVFAGALVGLGLLVLLTTLWVSLGFGSDVTEIRDNLEWYVGGSAIGCLFVGGILAGWLSGVRGAGSGFFSGVTLWALMLVLIVAAGVPAVFNVLNLGRVTPIDVDTGGLLASNENVWWATFFAIVGGLLASGIGGAIGGAVTRPANAQLTTEVAPSRPDVVVVEDRDDRTERDERVRVHEHDDDEAFATTSRTDRLS